MRVVPFVFLSVLFVPIGCAPRWVYVTESETTEFYLDSKGGSRISESAWEVRERFLDKATDRWYVEAEVQYDCVARTFMTVRIKAFSEYRPQRNASPIQGNLPVMVVPGSQEEVRLNAVCALFERG
jgi:hypothetical protein